MTELEKLNHKLFVENSVKNVKVFLGENPNITAEDIAKEMNYAFKELEDKRNTLSRITEGDIECIDHMLRGKTGGINALIALHRISDLARQEVKNQWQPIHTATDAKKSGAPILGWCVNDEDPYFEPNLNDGLTTYGAHAEGFGYAADGLQIIHWGGGYRLDEDEGGGYIPDWWFVLPVGSADDLYQIPANPTHWRPAPTDSPKK